ncbi:regulatory solute carrier protein family 1 member 1 [Orycteropus afer afer]|uniref:Regulatory solute carrier protein family 1 member 1 n=1 Tax=Orycteropus afer afer TaxID=1230840 RepID=A0A8B7ALS7_ORYAF|nr:regulatory solute carrier protein family 1 member 1 [Orycteropus afer afer]
MSSLPTSDGFNHLAHPSGQSPEIGNHTSLAHSVSASVCPIKPSDPGSLEPTALEALKTSAELRITSEKREHLLPLQELSDHASLAGSTPADQSPAMPLQNSSEEAVVADNLKKSAEKSTQGFKFHLHTRQETSLSVTATRIREPQMFFSEKDWHPDYQNLSQVNGLQQHEEPGNEQHEVVQQGAPHDREHTYNTGDLELLGERRQIQQNCVDSEAESKGNRLQQNVDLRGTDENILPSEYSGCSNSETLMEVDILEQPLVSMFNSAGSQNASVKNVGASDLTLDNPLMEVETSKYHPSSEISTNSISTQDLHLPESNVKISGTNKEYGSCSPSLSLCGSCQPSVESTEESYTSITTALKELHELLVISSNPASENTSEDVFCQSDTGGEAQTDTKDLSERWTQNESLTATKDEQRPQESFHQTVLLSVTTEKCMDTSPGAEIEDVENNNLRGPGDGMPTDKEDVPKSRELVNETNSIPLALAKTSDQLHCTLGAEISPKLLAGEEDTLTQTSEQTKSLPSSFIVVKDLGQDIQNPVTDRPETRENVCPEAASPFLELEPPTSHPSSPSFLPPLIFPAADIDRILRAGFTFQEALGALHRVGGNADLALLVLLAKNIVVPT